MITKHIIFKVPILDEGEHYDISSDALIKIDDFLLNPNYVYINHSTTVLGRDLRQGSNNYRDVTLIVSLIYKDLNDTPSQIKNVSAKTKEIVRKSIEKNSELQNPNLITKLDALFEKNKK